MKRFALLAILLLTTACATTAHRMRDLDLGMSAAQVESALGQPDGKMQEGPYLAFRYANQRTAHLSNFRTDYWVLFKDGVTVQYGPGEIQNTGPETLVIVPVG